MKSSLTIAICTKDRDHMLVDCISHALQSVKHSAPDFATDLMVVDDGKLAANVKDNIERAAADGGVGFVYLRKPSSSQKGLYGSRVFAVQKCKTTHLLFIDDDCLLGKSYIGSAMGLIHSKPDISAVSGVDHRNIQPPSNWQRILWRVFLLSDGANGKLSSTGFNNGHSYWASKTEDFECDFVHGCNMLFTTSSLRSLPDCAWLDGHSICEDMVLARTASNSGKIIISPCFEFEHLETPGGRGDSLHRLKRKIANHFHFHRMKNGKGIHDLLFGWSVVGSLVNVALKLVIAKMWGGVHIKR